jgi:7-cyano-7-deazaguanine reductase
MALKELDNKNISKHLGKSSQYISTYDPSLLVREPRASNRVHLNISDDNPPFVGFDTWNAYEVSALMNNGVPVIAVAKIIYPATNKYIVESKSIKLYFNSFNMTKLGDDRLAVLRSIKEMVQNDLSNLLETTVEVIVHSNKDVLLYKSNAYNEWSHDKFSTLEDEYNVEDLTVTKYAESPELLEVVESVQDTVYYHSALLKSNCRVTSQPDWGDVFIRITKRGQTIDPVSLLKYIISFRSEAHFHEEITECIYKRIHDILRPDELIVYCLYARRGGIDINPIRASSSSLLQNHPLLDDIPHIKTPKQ